MLFSQSKLFVQGSKGVGGGESEEVFGVLDQIHGALQGMYM